MASRTEHPNAAAPNWERSARVLQPMIATMFFLSSLRLLVGQMSIRIYDRFGLTATVIIGLIAFSTPLLAVALKRWCSRPTTITLLPLVMALLRVAGQILNWPDLNWLFAGLTIMLYGLFLPLYAGWLAARERRGIYAIAWGIVAAIPVDICLRVLFSSADLFFERSVTALLVVILLGLVFSSRLVTWPRRVSKEPVRTLNGGGWLDGLILSGLGATLFLIYALFGNAALAGPLANAPYPAAVATCAGIAVLAAAALYNDAGSVRFLDESPLATALIAGSIVLACTGILVFYPTTHWSLPLIALGLGALQVIVVIFGRLLVSTAGHPTQALGLGLWIGFLLLLGLSIPMLLYGDLWTLAIAAGLVFSTAIAAGMLLRRRRCPARVIKTASWVWIVGATLIALTVLVLFVQPQGEQPEPRDEVTLMTYNIRSGYGADDTFDLRRTAASIIIEDADIVALQEVNRGSGLNGFTDDIIRLMAVLRPAGYRYWEFGPADNARYGNAIISRYPIVASQTTIYDTVVSEERSVLAVRVKIGGRRLAVFNTHLTHVGASSPERISQINELMDIVAEENLPVVILGDMNSEPSYMEYQLLEMQFTDVYRAAGPDDAGHTYRADNPYARIDYIFASPDLIPLEAHVAQEASASDHRPVVARVRITL